MERKLGFIGCGNMASAIIGGIIDSGLVDRKNIYGSSRTQESANQAGERFAINIVGENRELAGLVDIIFLGVKPNVYEAVIEEIRDYVGDDTVIVSMAAGKDLAFLEKAFGRDLKIMRTMPNTPAKLGQAMTSISFNSRLGADKETRDYLIRLFEGFGRVIEIDEDLYHVATALSGSSPAYAYMFIEALADGGVLGGMKREDSIEMAAQALYGAAKMVLETGIHPAQLKDQVCSPGGTTISAVRALEETKFRSSVISAVEACIKKSEDMSK